MHPSLSNKTRLRLKNKSKTENSGENGRENNSSEPKIVMNFWNSEGIVLIEVKIDGSTQGNPAEEIGAILNDRAFLELVATESRNRRRGGDEAG